MRRKLLFVLTSLFALPVIVYLAGTVTGFFGHAGGVPANLLIDLNSAIPDHSSWKNLAQGGEEQGRMLASVIPQIKSLGPNYIRLDHIMESAVTKSGNQINFNWSKLDADIADIQSSGAKPFLSISYMPPSFTTTGNTTDLPVNWGDWEFAVQSLIQHVSGRSGLNLSEVYYEVWNEPDLFGGFKLYGPKNYLTLYSHTIAGAGRAQGVNPFKIGGPASTGLYENWAVSFLESLAASNLRIDFYSWHSYSKNLDQYTTDMLNIKTWLAERTPVQYKNLELMITEIGPNGAVDPVYDNGFGAIHALATTALMEDNINRLFTFEIKDGPGPSQYWGRWGLLTNDKFGAPQIKPRYNALSFLNNMRGVGVGTFGQGSWIKAFSRLDGKTLKTLVVNYDTDGKHVEAVPMTYINLPDTGGQFEFKRINWNGGPNTDIKVATTSATWATVQLMNPNTAAIMEVIFP